MVGRLHPYLVRCEQGEVAGDVACVRISNGVFFALFFSPVPPGCGKTKVCRQTFTDKRYLYLVSYNIEIYSFLSFLDF